MNENTAGNSAIRRLARWFAVGPEQQKQHRLNTLAIDALYYIALWYVANNYTQTTFCINKC